MISQDVQHANYVVYAKETNLIHKYNDACYCSNYMGLLAFILCVYAFWKVNAAHVGVAAHAAQQSS